MSPIAIPENKILSQKQTQQKVKRIAYEIYEQNFEESSLVIAGIWQTGYNLAQLIAQELENISPLKVQLVKIQLDKNANTQPEVSLDIALENIRQHAVIVVDDVLNTGKTLAHSLRPFFNLPLPKLQVAVLVDRSHRKFPVSADYVGYELSTTINEHVEVRLTEEDFAVYLY
ncbi:phosphoribosyltransferase family protein [Rapidithrix thailandica]|uniref:Phosphoribosyltransferase family protein n=1 Tax=Rapidithrix thailandica TaxID=413964 RepID=A0AAW9SCV8_9BACT